MMLHPQTDPGRPMKDQEALPAVLIAAKAEAEKSQTAQQNDQTIHGWEDNWDDGPDHNHSS